MKSINKYFKQLTVVSIALFFISCQEVIQIDLNSTDPKIVVEGKISAQDSVAFVKLNYSVNFDQTNKFPPVTNAKVVITDSNGAEYNLSETIINKNGIIVSPGYYTTKLQGLIGTTYYLTIETNGKTLTSTSTLHPAVPIDSIYAEDAMDFHPRGVSSQYMICQFTDAPGIKNYYRFIQYINGREDPYIIVGDDNLMDGTSFNASLFGSKLSFSPGDTVTVKMQQLDKTACEYLITLGALSEERGMGGSATPTNPLTNIVGGGLGYFSAYSEVQKTLIIPGGTKIFK